MHQWAPVLVCIKTVQIIGDRMHQWAPVLVCIKTFCVCVCVPFELGKTFCSDHWRQNAPVGSSFNLY